MLADDMGLGKTIQIISYLAALHYSGILQEMHIPSRDSSRSAPKSGGVLIVVPKTLICQWQEEFAAWYPALQVHLVHADLPKSERFESIKAASTTKTVALLSFELWRGMHQALLEAAWSIIVVDEGHKIANPHADITLMVKQVETAHRVVLSGTPTQGTMQELWSQLDFCRPGILGTLPVFRNELARPVEAGLSLNSNTASAEAARQCAMAFRQLVKPCILRRTKDELTRSLKLPEKSEQVVFCYIMPEQYLMYIQLLQTAG